MPFEISGYSEGGFLPSQRFVGSSLSMRLFSFSTFFYFTFPSLFLLFLNRALSFSDSHSSLIFSEFFVPANDVEVI